MSMKYAVEQRLRFIDFLLAQYGHVGRSALINYFGIAHACATKDLTTYKKMAPDNMAYNGIDKTYCKTAKFQRVWP